MENFKIYIQGIPGRLTVNVFIVRDSPEKNGIEYQVMEKGDLTYKTVERGNVVEPLFQIHEDGLESLLKALSQRGVKLPDESYTKGMLEATERHLEDMRTIAMLPRRKHIKQK